MARAIDQRHMAYCAHCGYDFRQWHLLAPSDQQLFLLTHQDLDISHLLAGRCPSCARPYQTVAANIRHAVH